MDSSVAIFPTQENAVVQDNRLSASTQLIATLERLAHNAGLEARLRREGTANEGGAIAAVRRVSVLLARQSGLGLSEDDRGDLWATLDGKAVAHLGNANES